MNLRWFSRLSNTSKRLFVVVLKKKDRRSFSWFSNQGNNLQTAIRNAEKLVGYPTTFYSWKYLFDEEPATFIGLAKKIIGTGNPLLMTARDVLSQDPYSANYLGGLWVLLVSKASGVNMNLDLDGDFVQGIHQKQRVLAETMELINTAFLIHRNMLALDDENYLPDGNKDNLEFGKKLFVLGGDFFLAKASLSLAKLENTDVVGMIGESIGDMTEGATLEDMDNLHWDVKAWEDYIFKLRGSLMANSCKSSTRLMEHGDDADSNAFEFGKHLVFAQHCACDIESFVDKKKLIKRTNYVLISALQGNPGLKKLVTNSEEIWRNLQKNLDMKTALLNSRPDIIEEVKKSCETYIDICGKNIALFPHAETVEAIQGILRTMSER